MKKVGIIGHFAFGKNKLNGQTVKTLAVAKILTDAFGEDAVLCKDTCGGAMSLLRIFKDAKELCRGCEHKIVMLAQNGLKHLVPVLYRANGKSGEKMHLIAIGGWLPEYLVENHKIAEKIREFSGVYVETEEMEAKLRRMGFKNIILLPNFKPFEKRVENVKNFISEPVRLCTFSRVTAEKGIREAMLAVQLANRKGKRKYELCVYGQVDKSFEKDFFELLVDDNSISYGGEIAYDACVHTLKSFDGLLFPTYYAGEGLAGTILDAFSAGLAVIASDFKYNRQYIEHGRNGLLVPPNDAAKLADAIVELYEERDVIEMRNASLRFADRFGAKRAAEILLEKII
ncbi:MAG: glycosyltransferase family 4 protein [Clostridia bacterium]|nr:glycosyltransferase family 4 protein [Clostridia bacterium]